MGTLTLVLVLQSVRKTRKLALLIGVLAGTVAVLVGHLDVPVVVDGADIISGLGALPTPNSVEDLPDLALIPQCALAALAVTMIALAEGAGLRPAFPNPDGSPSSPPRDFVGAGVENLSASVFMSPPVGGSLSRTAMSASSGGRTRWAAVFAAVWLNVILVAAPGAPRVLVIDVSSIEDVGDTLARSIDGYVRELQAAGARLVLCDVQPKACQRRERFGLINLIDTENVLAALPHLGANIEAGSKRGELLRQG